MDKDTLIKIGNLVVKMLTPIVEAEREKSTAAKARAQAAEAEFRRTHCQLCYEPRGELDVEVSHRVVCRGCLDRCTRALLDRRARLRDQQLELDDLIGTLSTLLRDDSPHGARSRATGGPRTQAPERIKFGDILEGVDGLKAREPDHRITFRDVLESMNVGGPSQGLEREPTIDPRARAGLDPLASTQTVSERLEEIERLLQERQPMAERLIRGRSSRERT